MALDSVAPFERTKSCPVGCNACRAWNLFFSFQLQTAWNGAQFGCTLRIFIFILCNPFHHSPTRPPQNRQRDRQISGTHHLSLSHSHTRLPSCPHSLFLPIQPFADHYYAKPRPGGPLTRHRRRRLSAKTSIPEKSARVSV